MSAPESYGLNSSFQGLKHVILMYFPTEKDVEEIVSGVTSTGLWMEYVMGIDYECQEI